MWKAVVGHNVSVKVEAEGDDWDTDPDFVNDISEREQRWGAKTIEGSGRAGHIDIHQLRNKVSEEHEVIKKKELETGPKASYGYGGKFGTERDRMDKCAVGHEYIADVGKHSSQTDAAQGFGGKFGVQRDRADKSALGFEYKSEVEKHSSQKDYSKGFGGRYGVERDKVDKAAVGFDYKSQAEKHDSQKDYSVGFGGKFGVQRDRQDKNALGWDHQEEVQPHASQRDYAKGFGGRYGVQKDRVDKPLSIPPEAGVAAGVCTQVLLSSLCHCTHVAGEPAVRPAGKCFQSSCHRECWGGCTVSLGLGKRQIDGQASPQVSPQASPQLLAMVQGVSPALLSCVTAQPSPLGSTAPFQLSWAGAPVSLAGGQQAHPQDREVSEGGTAANSLPWARAGVQVRTNIPGNKACHHQYSKPALALPNGLNSSFTSSCRVLALMRWQLPPPPMRKQDPWRQEPPVAPAACGSALSTWPSRQRRRAGGGQRRSG
ncbi:src substrate cortactin-like isoform X2 [Haemorhous mexicanus]|nr:src substrate cortactin-like isoform X2 [Haemorhous mexicanus]